MKDQELRRQFAAKSLNLPYDTMGDINVQNGSSLRDILAGGLVAAALLGGGGGAALLLTQYLAPKAEKAVETVIETDVWDYRVEMEVQRNP